MDDSLSKENLTFMLAEIKELNEKLNTVDEERKKLEEALDNLVYRFIDSVSKI